MLLFLYSTTSSYLQEAFPDPKYLLTTAMERKLENLSTPIPRGCFQSQALIKAVVKNLNYRIPYKYHSRTKGNDSAV